MTTSVQPADRFDWRRRAPRSWRPLRTLDDDRLLALARSGHPSALSELFGRHRRGLLAFSRHMLGSLQDAEDVVQHVFEAAHRSAVEGREVESAAAWLYAVARNRCVSLLRARQPVVDLSECDAPVADVAVEVEQREDLRALLADLRRLDEQPRAALLLSEIGALSHREIAQVLEVEPLRVKKLVFLAREHLAAGQQAREMTCIAVREELASLTRGALRRGYLRAHLAQCEGCAEFREEVRRQRRGLAILLPVAPGGLTRWWLATRGRAVQARRLLRPRSLLSHAAVKGAVVLTVAVGAGVAGAVAVSGIGSSSTGASAAQRTVGGTGTLGGTRSAGGSGVHARKAQKVHAGTARHRPAPTGAAPGSRTRARAAIAHRPGSAGSTATLGGAASSATRGSSAAPGGAGASHSTAGAGVSPPATTGGPGPQAPSHHSSGAPAPSGASGGTTAPPASSGGGGGPGPGAGTTTAPAGTTGPPARTPTTTVASPPSTTTTTPPATTTVPAGSTTTTGP